MSVLLIRVGFFLCTKMYQTPVTGPSRMQLLMPPERIIAPVGDAQPAAFAALQWH
jgi:hypothetical protein